MTSLFRLVVLTVLLCLGTPSRSAIMAFNTQSAFLAAIAGPGVDTYDDLNAGQPYPSPLARTAGSYGYLATVVSGGGLFATGFGSDSWLSTNAASDTIRFSDFDTAISAIGGFFFATGVNGDVLLGQTILIDVTDGFDTLQMSIANPTTDTFVGFASTRPIFALEVSAQQPVEVPFPFPTVNDLILASPLSSNAVPEPASLVLTGVGLVGMLLVRLRSTNTRANRRIAPVLGRG